MATLIKQFSGFLILILFSSISLAASVTKCVDAKGNITFTTMGCKTSETDVKAVEEAKAKLAAEEKAKAEAKAEEEAAMKRATTTKTSSTSSSDPNPSTANVSSTSSESNVAITAPQGDSGNKAGARGSINGDLTIGYQ